MFELITYRCPHCDAEIRKTIKDAEELTCTACQSCFTVMLDEKSGKAALIGANEQNIREPLSLPRGSIRAIATLCLAFSCWLLVLRGLDVPTYLLSLLLTIIGYYFGFRKKVKAAQSKIFDASAKTEEPLFLPGGFIRFVLIVGFAITAVILYAKGRLFKSEYLEFFVILCGLILGYLCARLFSHTQSQAIYNSINHLKGAIVLVAVLCLSSLFITARYADNMYTALSLSCIVSFYFGSRS